LDGVPEAQRTSIVNAVVESAGTAIPAITDPAIASAAREAFSDGTRYAALGAAGFLAIGFLATLRLDGSRDPEEKEIEENSKKKEDA
jgi:hypothetical protein